MTGLPLDLGCQELVELVTDYLEARLSAEDRTRFEVHLEDCDACRSYLLQMRQVLAATGRLSGEAIAPQALGALLAVFRAWKAKDGRAR
jgi:anti-sigma factor RsiW